MMHMQQALVQNQSQRLMLTQKMQQALQILQYSAVELEQHVQQELESNPLLEQVVKTPEVEVAPPEEPATNGHDGAALDDSSFNLDEYASAWEQKAKEGRDLSINTDSYAKRDFYENSITKEESLSAKLMTQLRLAFADEALYTIGECIVGEIDDRGYFTGSLEELADSLTIELTSVERVLYRIQKFEPTGVGARDVVECLLLQINATYPDEPQLSELVGEHLEALQHRQIPKIAKAMGVSPDRVEELKRLLSVLDPWPGYEYSAEPTQYIAAELVVEKIEDEFVVRLTVEGTPELRINQDYRQMAKGKTTAKEDKVYLREKTESARWLIRNIEQRQQTILKIGKAIIDVQWGFLEKGVDEIKPLTLQEIADVVGVHEATVSRTTRGKYMQTPQGLFELKYFFSPGLKSVNGASKSSKSVQSTIKKIIGAEDKHKPLSDQKIADLLKTQGTKIARRTVTKYRENMNIPSTTMRKEYQAT